MEKYISNENSTIEIALASWDDYRYIAELIPNIITLNIQRLLVNVIDSSLWDACEVEQLIFLSFEKDFDIFFRTLHTTTDFLDININLSANIIMLIDVNALDEKLLSRFSSYYFEVSYSGSQISQLMQLLCYHSESIILNPVADLTNIDEYVESVVGLIEKTVGMQLLFSPILIPKAHICEHPCVVYLCSGNKCHNGHNNFPRHISIDKQKNVYFYSFYKKVAGNLSDGNLLRFFRDIRANPVYQKFLKANRELYFDIFDKYFIGIIPWFAYLERYL